MTLKMLTVSLLAIATAQGATILFGPSPYLSIANIPFGFYAGGSPAALENFEDGTLGLGITASTGGTDRIDVDSVDGDDGVIDGSGSAGRSWFVDEASTGVRFTFASPVTAAGLVWTDSLAAVIEFEAFGPGMVSLGSYLLGPLGDALVTGTTAEDRFVGVQNLAGISAIQIRALTAVGTSGLEVDHVQFGSAPVPEPSTLILEGIGLAGLLGFGWRRAKAIAPCLLCLAAAFAPSSASAATMVITDPNIFTSASWLNDWTNQSTSGAASAFVGGTAQGPGFYFDTNFAALTETIHHTYTLQTWDTAALGAVASVRFILADQIVFGMFGSDLIPNESLTDTLFRTGSVVWNTTTNQYFRSVTNGSTPSLERVDALLTPSADYCLVGAGGTCTAISGFGDGILQFGIFAEADLRNETSRLATVAFSKDFSFTVTSVPEPSTGVMLVIAGTALCLGLLRRRIGAPS